MGVKSLGAGFWGQVGKGRVAKVLGDKRTAKDMKQVLQEAKVGSIVKR